MRLSRCRVKINVYNRHIAWELLSHAEGDGGDVDFVALLKSDRMFEFFNPMAVILLGTERMWEMGPNKPHLWL